MERGPWAPVNFSALVFFHSFIFVVINQTLPIPQPAIITYTKINTDVGAFIKATFRGCLHEQSALIDAVATHPHKAIRKERTQLWDGVWKLGHTMCTTHLMDESLDTHLKSFTAAALVVTFMGAGYNNFAVLLWWKTSCLPLENCQLQQGKSKNKFWFVQGEKTNYKWKNMRMRSVEMQCSVVPRAKASMSLVFWMEQVY